MDMVYWVPSLVSVTGRQIKGKALLSRSKRFSSAIRCLHEWAGFSSLGKIGKYLTPKLNASKA